MRWRWRRHLLNARLWKRLLLAVSLSLGLYALLLPRPARTYSTFRVRPVYIDEYIPPECECRDSATGIAYNFCYSPHFAKAKRGRRFACEHVEAMRKLGLLDSSGYLELEADPIPDPVFVSGSSDSHFSEQLRLVENMQKWQPNARIIVYDLGLKKESVERLRNLCQVVEVRAFNFSAYPPWVRNLHEYRWKPIIIAAALKEFGAIWWMDSSVVWKKTDLSHVYALLRCANASAIPDLLSLAPAEEVNKPPPSHDDFWIESGWHIPEWAEDVRRCHKFAYLLQGFTGHGIFPATSPLVFKWLPTDEERLKQPTAKMYEAGFLFTARTAPASIDVLKWYVLCALEKECMAPPGAHLGCRFQGKERFAQSAGCHRFDQSVVNLLLANRNDFDRLHYTSTIVDFFNIRRGAGATNPKICKAPLPAA